MERTIEPKAKQRQGRKRGSMDIERISVVLCKYAERFEAEAAEAEQVVPPMAATESTVQSTALTFDHR